MGMLDLIEKHIPDDVKKVAVHMQKVLAIDFPIMKTKIESIESRLENIEKLLEEILNGKDGKE